jgi:exonuclease SbcC
MAGTITNEEIAGTNENFLNLLSQLGNASLIDFKKKIGAKKKIIKEQLDTIPTRIDEAKRNMPEVADYATIEKQIDSRKKEVEGIDQQMQDKTASFEKEFEGIREKMKEKSLLEGKLNDVMNEGKRGKASKLQDLESQLKDTAREIKSDEAEIESNNNAVSRNNNQINKLESENKALRTDWEKENARELVIDEHAFDCPTCKQKLPEGNAEEVRNKLTANFNNDKADRLKRISDKGTQNKAEIERLRTSNETFDKDTQAINDRILGLKAKLESLYIQKQNVEKEPVQVDAAKVTLLEKQIKDCVVPESPKIDNSELKTKKTVLLDEIDSLKQTLSSKDQIEKLNQRIDELEKEEEKLSQELADLERTEFTIDAFSKAKIETIEARINGKFRIVKFKMFQEQINGGEVECCECLVNGVPYSDVNTAGKIQAGIDIINALTDHYNTSAPVWIDNRESVIRIPECKSQIINLRAVKGAKLSATIEKEEELLAA